MLPSTRVMQQDTHSSVRRKPLRTFKSPSAGDWSFDLSRKPVSSSVSQIPASVKSFIHTSAETRSSEVRNGPARIKYPMGPPLPLYHPMGRLALSLPPLDPASFGLPLPPTLNHNDFGRRSSSRARRPAAKLRDAEEESVVPTVSVSTIAAVAAQEIIEKATPRKKRVFGGGTKRRRKDDDGDATYPTKRTRIPRATGNNVADEESPAESVTPVPDTSEPTIGNPDQEDKAQVSHEQSLGNGMWRDSSASEVASASSLNILPSLPNHPEAIEVIVPDEGVLHPPSVKYSSGHEPGAAAADEKEDGEISDEKNSLLP